MTTFCSAQNSNSGEIRGTVTDASGAAVPAVQVTILNTDTGVTRDLTTNDSGVYDAVSILPGNYQLTFNKPGFEKLVRSGVNLTANPITIDARLSVGAAQQEVQVTAEVPQLQTESGEQSTTLEAKSMQELPNVGQTWANFTRILPGAAGSGTGVAVNGNLPYYSNFLADGANVTLPHSANVDTMVFEDVAEVQMSTSSFSAQYGVGGAVFNQISKGGTNQFHGSLYEYVQNDFFNARNFFSATVPPLHYNNFGGSVGGPILKNRVFFFFNVDKTINNTSSVSTNTYPTADMRAGDFSNPIFPTIYEPGTYGTGPGGGAIPFPGNKIPSALIDPLAANMQTLYPTPNQPGYVNNWVGNLPFQSPFLRFFGRLDYNISDKNRLTMSVTQRDNPEYGPAADYPLDTNNVDINSYNAQISDVWTATTNIVNEFRFGFTRQGNYFIPVTLNANLPQKIGWTYPLANVAPSIYISGKVCCNGITPGTNAIYVENSFDPSDVVTMIRGKHILKFGGEVLMYQDNSTPWGNVNAGTFGFSGVFTQRGPFDSTNGAGGQSGLGYADFLLGQVDNWNASNTPIVGMRQKSPQFFVQDDYKLRPNLTLNLGLRYQIQGGWSEVANRLGTFDPTIINPVTGTPGAMWFGGQNGRNLLEANNYKIFLPRIGFAWQPKNNWAIRGGAGIYTYNWSIDTYAGGAEGLGTNSHGSLAQTNHIDPVFILGTATYANLNYVGPDRSPTAFNNQGTSYYPYHTPVARNYQWSLSVERQMPGNTMLQLAYVGSHATALSFPIDFNQVPANLLAESVAPGSNPQSLRPYPIFQGISANLYNGISNYNSAQVTFSKRMSYGLQFDLNYTWSRMQDDQDSSGWGSRDGGQIYQNSYDIRANYGPSNFDIPQMFKGDVVYQLPFGRGKAFMNRGGLLDAVFGGWQASTIFTLEDGRPFTFVVGGANNSGSLTSNGSWYPNVVGNPSIPNQSINEWFNTCYVGGGCSNPAFAIPAPGTFGNSGRNTFRGPGLTDVDFSLGKNFRIPLPRETGNL
ncbi:MAG: TonB-dependent receptor, partial [Acidobacteriales bacterium]|nr:TonB-dependent receptor [Terriglobales bacterium]